MLPTYTIKVERSFEDLYSASGWGEALNLANNKIFSFSPNVRSVVIIRHGSSPGSDVIVARWSKGKGWSYAKG